ncbi:MAG TPA: endonuclease V [Actinomycetota bacterium]
MQRGPLLESALRALKAVPDVVLVNATGRDHPRRAGLALHLGAALDLPTVGVTERPLMATAGEPGPDPGAASPGPLPGPGAPGPRGGEADRSGPADRHPPAPRMSARGSSSKAGRESGRPRRPGRS